MTLTPDVSAQNDALDAMLADPEIRESLAVIVANAPTLAALAAMGTAPAAARTGDRRQHQRRRCSSCAPTSTPASPASSAPR